MAVTLNTGREEVTGAVTGPHNPNGPHFRRVLLISPLKPQSSGITREKRPYGCLD